MKKVMVKVNFVNEAIEMTPAFAEAAGKVGSDAYKQLVEIKNDFPGFKVTVVAPKKKAGNQIKGLTMEYMEKYIIAHDDDKHATLNAFAALRGMIVSKDGKLEDDTSKEVKAVKSYGEIKLWFLETYHEAFDTYNKEADEIMKKTKEAKATRLAS